MISRQRGRKRLGFSIMELMVAMSIFTIVMASLMKVVIDLQKRFVDQRERVRAQESLRVAQMTLAPLMRSAGADPKNSTLTGMEVDPDNNGIFDDIRIKTDFNPIDGDIADVLEDVHVYVSTDTLWIRWQAGAAAQPLAFPIKSLRFEYYGNNGAKMLTVPEIVGATRARFILESPRDARTKQLERTEAWWVNLRNRQGL